jgi:NAD(P) transhydrogenase
MKLLGVHVIGEQAAQLVHVGLMTMLTGATVEIFEEACFNGPALDALYKFAALDAMLRNSAATSISLPAI